MGFQNFDMDGFGVVSPGLKRLAKTPKISLPQIKMENTQSLIVEWQGWKVKNLETLGERSATGMDSEHGVYVVSQVKPESNMKGLLRENDAIIKFDGKIINKLIDLQEATQKADLTKQLEMVLFRNQKEVVVAIPGNTLQ
jgi:S1-C subfamily serine protease